MNKTTQNKIRRKLAKMNNIPFIFGKSDTGTPYFILTPASRDARCRADHMALLTLE